MRAKEREFSLDCFFEEQTTEKIEKMMMWLGKDRMGDLILDDRPFVRYSPTRISKIVTGKFYPCTTAVSQEMGYSGTMTIQFKCYSAYGEMDKISYDGYDEDGASRYCGILEKSMTPQTLAPSAGDYLIYNPGTQTCDTVITIAGSAPNGVTITNETNGTKCSLVALPSSGAVTINSRTGTVRTEGGFAFA